MYNTFLNSVTNLCECNSLNCYDCSKAALNECTTCVKGYNINASKGFDCSVSNCTTCNKSDGSICDACKKNY